MIVKLLFMATGLLLTVFVMIKLSIIVSKLCMVLSLIFRGLFWQGIFCINTLIEESVVLEFIQG